ncbi:hypothetical protein LUZ63_012222 [Rhynchospora breviuscula]|uniref:Uncharacterized protein n=1 Tax=Rhynchospora breviuscula TaxID=2022672 RepID=A0A9Q0CL98_9POAL|nr:hypothetical protein LUZ63_012222 [Rhynchospora breviuscula]
MTTVEPIVLATLGWVASPLVTKVINKACDHLDTSRDEIQQRLEATVLPRLALAIDKAERSSNRHKLEAWLKRLKDAYYKAEEAIDLLEYERLKQEVKADRKTRIRLRFQSVPVPSILVQKIVLKGRIDKIIEIAKEANEFRDLVEAAVISSAPNNEGQTISQPLGKIFGREKDIEAVVGLLTVKPLDSEPGPSNKHTISVIAITGRSGIGKTALAQCVYHHMDKQSKQKERDCFHRVLWVNAPRKFMAADGFMKILQNIHAKYDPPEHDNYNTSGSINDLGTLVNRMLGFNKFLLILDDFWCDAEDDRKQWEMFISCLIDYLPGSKILLTTQNNLTAEQASLAGQTEVKTYSLQDIKEDQFFKLFMYHAWSGDYSVEIEQFGHTIAAKLKLDPGAAKLVGHQLRVKPDISHWKEISRKDWSRDEEFMKPRIWSYQQLPVHLQRCFAICCLFPKGAGLGVNLLIHFWMAEGFIKEEGGKRMEDIGKNYLNELVNRFFVEEYADERVIYYRLHDLLHDLAEQVQGDDFLKIDYINPRNVPEHVTWKLSQSNNIRHIYLLASRIIEFKDKICLMKNLRTLCVQANCSIPKNVLQEILESSKKLRVLYLFLYDGYLPNCVGNLKHLRFLHLKGSLHLRKLPPSICKLYLLQTLILPSCELVPKELSELINLRDIDVEDETILSHISHVGRMTCLQGLKQFAVTKARGHELHQLENLNQLRGRMCITGLENLTSIDDAINAKIKSKTHLEELEFRWNSYERVVDDFQLLDALQPHYDVTGLTVNCFIGKSFPNWLLGPNPLEHLNKLVLINCVNISSMSSISESLPNCESLSLIGLFNLIEMPLLPPKLVTLILHQIPLVDYISESDLLMKKRRKESMSVYAEKIKMHMGSIKQDVKVLFEPVERYAKFVKTRDPGMEKIDPQNQLSDAWDTCMRCHLESMLNKERESKLFLPPSLSSLVISLCSITSDALSTCIQSLVALSELILVEIQTITSLPPQETMCTLKNLRYICIKDCYLLSSLGGIRTLTSLKSLKLERCLSLENSSIEQLPSSLQKLEFIDCANIDAILDRSDLPVLTVMNVWNVVYGGHLRDNNEREVLRGVLRVGHFSRLKELTIGGGHICLDGLNSLTSLYCLRVFCSTIYPSSRIDNIQIKVVCVQHPSLLKKMLSDEIISSIEALSILAFGGDSIDDEVFQSLTSLKHLHIEQCDITHLPVQLKTLPSLRSISLNDCSKLCEVESLPKNLFKLEIKDCPTLLEKLNNDGSFLIWYHEGTTIIRFSTEGQTTPRPSQLTQQVGKSHPAQQPLPNRPQVLHLQADQYQSSTTTVQRHRSIEALPDDSSNLPRPQDDLTLLWTTFAKNGFTVTEGLKILSNINLKQDSLDPSFIALIQHILWTEAAKRDNHKVLNMLNRLYSTLSADAWSKAIDAFKQDKREFTLEELFGTWTLDGQYNPPEYLITMGRDDLAQTDGASKP